MQTHHSAIMLRIENYMLRRAITSYLALLMVAAPCLCCCTAGRLIAHKQSDDVQAQPKSSCCCGQDSDSTSIQGAAPIKSLPVNPERCPCRDHADQLRQSVASPNLDRELALLDASAHSVAFESAISNSLILCVETADEPMQAVASEDPFWSASELLHIQHRLRC